MVLENYFIHYCMNCPSDIDAQIICLNSLKAQDPKEQAIEIASLAGHDPMIVLSESYSGYIAYQLSLLTKC